MQYIIKVIISAIVVVGVAELAKRFTPVAAIIASLPLTSILAIVWLYRDTNDVNKIINLSQNIFWAVLPSLLFFIILPLLLKAGLNFYLSLFLSSIGMFLVYTLYIFALSRLNISI